MLEREGERYVEWNPDASFSDTGDQVHDNHENRLPQKYLVASGDVNMQTPSHDNSFIRRTSAFIDSYSERHQPKASVMADPMT